MQELEASRQDPVTVVCEHGDTLEEGHGGHVQHADGGAGEEWTLAGLLASLRLEHLERRLQFLALLSLLSGLLSTHELVERRDVVVAEPGDPLTSVGTLLGVRSHQRGALRDLIQVLGHHQALHHGVTIGTDLQCGHFSLRVDLQETGGLVGQINLLLLQLNVLEGSHNARTLSERTDASCVETWNRGGHGCEKKKKKSRIIRN
mmetsp:Transcript_26985/g.67826  ORF Transcript_26985/g.67826 Transcript_26985/m.67826 type:complete len:204 (+) Transcript_26985:178-789(+)